MKLRTARKVMNRSELRRGGRSCVIKRAYAYFHKINSRHDRKFFGWLESLVGEQGMIELREHARRNLEASGITLKHAAETERRIEEAGR